MDAGQFLRELGEFLLPPRCRLCNAFCRDPICSDCRDAFARIEPPFCGSCGLPLEEPAPAADVCAGCRGKRSRLERVRSVGVHSDGLREAVNALKFGGKIRLAEPLGKLLGGLVSGPAAVLSEAEGITDVVPVPLHAVRQRERGFNQAELLAAPLAESSGLPLRSGVLLRTRNTPPQINLTAPQRAGNVRGAFAVSRPLPVPGVRPLLVDDVYTTGATLEECARILLKGGAEAVYAVTLTRRALD